MCMLYEWSCVSSLGAGGIKDVRLASPTWLHIHRKAGRTNVAVKIVDGPALILLNTTCIEPCSELITKMLLM